MSEVINISASQFANHVITHLYNKQESHIPYKVNQKLPYDNNVFLSSTKINGRTNYSPRSILFDVKNGFGSLGRYEYYQAAADINSMGFEVVNTMEKLEKNQYQQGLDKGKSNSQLLNNDNTKYWSDYNKLIYKPTSLVSLESWEMDLDYNVVNKFTPNMRFDKFAIGTNEFKSKADDVVDNFRRYLEECNYFQGLQVSTELDNSWGGFSTELLTNIKDEFFNYTSNNKFTIWTFGYLSPKLTTIDQRISRIKSFVELSKNSSLLIPLQRPTGSYWQGSTDSAILMNSIWEILNDNTTTMRDFESSLLNKESERNIVNNISIIDEPQMDSLDKLDKLQLYSMDPPQSTKSVSYGFNNTSKYKFGTNHISNDAITNDPKIKKDDQTTTYKAKNDLLNITKIDTFPNHKFNKISTEFSIDSSLVYDMKQYLKILDRVKYSEDIGDKDELIQDIHNLKTKYYDAPDFEYDSESD